LITATTFNRNSTQIGDTEALGELALNPNRVRLSRGAGDKLIVVNSYFLETDNTVQEIDDQGTLRQAGVLSALATPTLLQTSGSAWLTQTRASGPTESLNTITGAKYFLPSGGQHVPVNEALYKFETQNGMPTLRVFRSGQTATIALPAIIATMTSALAVEPSLTGGDDLRFILKTAINAQSGQFIVFGVQNGVAIERFRFDEFINLTPILLSDGSVVASVSTEGMAKKYATDGLLMNSYPMCGAPIDAGGGNVWSFGQGTDAFAIRRVCHTTRAQPMVGQLTLVDSFIERAPLINQAAVLDQFARTGFE
jgi:hypothetical protein